MFTPYKSTLDPEGLDAALKAFELAWAEIATQPDGYDHEQARDLLARRIVEAALENDERDPERLKSYALKGFDPHQQA